MGDGQEVPKEFPKRLYASDYDSQTDKPKMLYEEKRKRFHEANQKHTTIVQTLCWGCGAMIEDVIIGEDNWLFCPCGTGIMKVTI